MPILSFFSQKRVYFFILEEKKGENQQFTARDFSQNPISNENLGRSRINEN